MAITDDFLLAFHYIQCAEYLACFLANSLTIPAVIKFEKLNRKPTNLMILSLSIADGMLGTCHYTCYILLRVEEEGACGNSSCVHTCTVQK